MRNKTANIVKQNCIQFVFVLKATALKIAGINFFLQVLST